jgi:hypothetical protein
LDITSEGLGGMCEGESADMCAGKFRLVLMGDRAEGLACADPEVRTPIGASGNVDVGVDGGLSGGLSISSPKSEDAQIIFPFINFENPLYLLSNVSLSLTLSLWDKILNSK